MENNCNNEVKMLFFHASWCGNCKAMEPTVNAVVQETGIHFVSVDAEKDLTLCEKYGIMNLPVIVFTKDGNVLDKINGVVTKQNLLDKIKKVC